MLIVINSLKSYKPNSYKINSDEPHEWHQFGIDHFCIGNQMEFYLILNYALKSV